MFDNPSAYEHAQYIPPQRTIEPIDEWAERCLRTWPQLQAHWEIMRTETRKLRCENSLLRQALTKAVALPRGQLPHGDGYFTTMLSGNVVVTPTKREP